MELEFGDTPEEESIVVRGTLKRMYRDLYGNGEKGIVQRVTTFMDTFAAVEAEREKQQQKRHDENQARIQQVSNQIGKKTLWWTAAGVSLTLAGLLVSILAVMVAIKLAKTADLRDLLKTENPTQQATESSYY